MPSAAPRDWSDILRQTLTCYDEPLLRRVAARLIKPRNQWPADELVTRCAATADDITVIDRRLAELDAAGRRLLALLGHGRQPLWNMGNLVELLIALGLEDGLAPVLALLEAGLLYPLLGDEGARSGDRAPTGGDRAPTGGSVQANGPARPKAVRSFEQWLAFAGPENLQVFAHPLAMARALGEDLGLGACPGVVEVAGPALEADGLEWPLRLAVLWQQVAGSPLRRTQQGEFFKRDLERLSQGPLLNTPSVEGLPAPPDAGFLAVALGESEGIVREGDGELRAG